MRDRDLLDCADAGSSCHKMARRQSQGLFVRIVALSIIVEAKKQRKGGIQT